MKMLGRSGRGPTMFMSPFSTFTSCGSSSSRVPRRMPPIGVTRASFLVAHTAPASSAFTVIVRNLYIVNARPPTSTARRSPPRRPFARRSPWRVAPRRSLDASSLDASVRRNSPARARDVRRSPAPRRSPSEPRRSTPTRVCRYTIGPRDVAFTAIAITSINGASTMSAMSEIEKLTTRLSLSETSSSCTRDRSVRSPIVEGESVIGASKTGKVPVMSVLLSAPREAIRECPDECASYADDRRNLLPVATGLFTDLDRIPVAERELIERETFIQRRARIARIVQLSRVAPDHGLFEVCVPARPASAHDGVRDRDVRRHVEEAGLAHRAENRESHERSRLHPHVLDVSAQLFGEVRLELGAEYAGE